MMHNKNILLCRQQKLLFANERLWERIPQESQHRCQQLLVQLLRAVLHPEDDERSEDERQG